jgi:cytochrome b561
MFKNKNSDSTIDSLLESKPAKSYSIVAKIFHWGFVLVFVYGISKQVDELEQLADNSLLRFEMAFAAVFLLMLLARLIYMKKTQTSALPSNTSHLQKGAAKTVHYGMYVCLASISISGILIGTLYWANIKSGFVIEAVISVHEFSFTVIYGLIAIHIIAALYHRFLQDGVWNSMVPFWKEQSKLD